MLDLQTKLCRIFDRNSSVRIKFDFMFLYRSLGIHFQTDLSISMSCEFLGGISENWDSLKDKWQLPHVRPPGRDVTVDAAYSSKTKIASLGMVVWDFTSTICLCAVKKIGNIVLPLHAEFDASLLASRYQGLYVYVRIIIFYLLWLKVICYWLSGKYQSTRDPFVNGRVLFQILLNFFWNITFVNSITSRDLQIDMHIILLKYPMS